MPKYDTSLFIFRRDLRTIDNTALNLALHHSSKVIVCFIFDDRQINKHAYQSNPALHFMLQSLKDLKQQFQALDTKLSFFFGMPTNVIEQLHKQHKIQAVFLNRDYTPFSRKRDSEIANICQQLHMDLFIVSDALLNEPEQAVKSDGTPYKIFTAFYNNARRLNVLYPKELENVAFLSIDSADLIDITITKKCDTPIEGGRTFALRHLADLKKNCNNYTQNRDVPSLQNTSQLSAHLKFGTVSVREVFIAITQTLGVEHPLLRQLYWRDFFTHIAFHFPHVFGHAFIEKFDCLPWENNQTYFQAWAEGKTGFPIVDAGMRELKATGLMHNRVRMIAASFLTKDLRISWRWGERYFAQHLIDYDPSINNGNWQWAASTGCDAQPYFRIFNPWLQQVKFDPHCEYIYRWIPELSNIPPKIIHQWDKKHYGTYPPPMVDHSKEARTTKAMFESCN